MCENDQCLWNFVIRLGEKDWFVVIIRGSEILEKRFLVFKKKFMKLKIPRNRLIRDDKKGKL